MARIVVAMSGGVDSSVAAALLKEEGHEVIGMMLRLWSEPGEKVPQVQDPAAVQAMRHVLHDHRIGPGPQLGQQPIRFQLVTGLARNPWPE